MDRKVPQAWLAKASDDIQWTEANLREGIWYGACFTSQQAVEKALKAYVIYKKGNAKKIHSLIALLEECTELDNSFEELRSKCNKLTVYYALTRYVDVVDYTEFTEEKAREAYEFAKEIVNFVQKKLG